MRYRSGVRQSHRPAGPGDLFGEMTCMSLYPRSPPCARSKQTVVPRDAPATSSACCRGTRRSRPSSTRTYRQRALDTHLRSVPIFDGVSDDFLRQLATRIELVRFEPGQVIFRQGDPAESFYLVRIGFVRSPSHFPAATSWSPIRLAARISGDRTPGGRRPPPSPPAPRSTTSSWSKIGAEEFRDMLQRFPPVAERLAERPASASSRTRPARRRRAPHRRVLGQG